ncbi:MAG: hypothetical protein FWD65_04035 [Coriobacteriia bacterium]|nr:hypothetical protein [Coriobacteriia bacterium]
MKQIKVKETDIPGADIQVEHEYHSPTARRIATVILVFLILLLLIATLFLLRMMKPQGTIASGDAANGVIWVRSIYSTGPDKGNQLVSPAAVAFLPNGNIAVPIVTENQANVVEFTNTGQYVKWWGGPDNTDYRLKYPTGIAVGNDGSQYFIEGPNDKIVSLTSNGKEGRWLQRMEGPSSVASRNNRVVVGGSGGFALFDISGKLLYQKGAQGKGDGDFDMVGGVTLDDQNNIYVVDTYNNRISKYREDGTRVWIVKTGNPGNAAPTGKAPAGEVKSDAPANLQTPNNCVIDGSGRLVVVDPLDFSLSVFNTENGSFIGKYGTFGTEDGKFSYPTSVSYDPATDTFAVADTGNNRIQIIRLPGSGGSSIVKKLLRSLSGPVRACCFPLLLLIILAVIYGFTKFRTKRDVKVEHLEEDDGPAQEEKPSLGRGRKK